MSRRSSIKVVKQRSRGEELIAAMERGTDNERICAWPSKDGFEFVLVPLLCDQFQEAYSYAQKRFRDLDIEITLLTHDDFTSEISIQILAMAIRDIDDKTRSTRLFDSGNALRARIDPDQRNALTTEFLELQDEANPDLDELDPETVDKIRLAVKKKDQAELRSLGSATLSCFLVGMESPSES